MQEVITFQETKPNNLTAAIAKWIKEEKQHIDITKISQSTCYHATADVVVITAVIVYEKSAAPQML